VVHDQTDELSALKFGIEALPYCTRLSGSFDLQIQCTLQIPDNRCFDDHNGEEFLGTELKIFF